MTRYLILPFIVLTLSGCPSSVPAPAAPASPTAVPSTDTAANSPRGLETPLPAPALDPEGENQYLFVADSRSARRDPDTLQYEYQFVGHLSSVKRDPDSPRDRIETPVEAGRWGLVLDADHHACAVASVGDGGALSLKLASPGNIEFFFAVARPGYSTAGPGNLNDCPPFYAGKDPENYDFFPATFLDQSPRDMVYTFAPEPSSGIEHPANPDPRSGILHPAAPSDEETSGKNAPWKTDALRRYRLK